MYWWLIPISPGQVARYIQEVLVALLGCWVALLGVQVRGWVSLLLVVELVRVCCWEEVAQPHWMRCGCLHTAADTA